MPKDGVPKDDVTFILSKDEALVLFEWLFTAKALSRLPDEGTAEERVFWRLEGILEKTLAEPFRSDYAALVEAARLRLLADGD
jgi:hypothetical protein